jgi:hypothetical protein
MMSAVIRFSVVSVLIMGPVAGGPSNPLIHQAAAASDPAAQRLFVERIDIVGNARTPDRTIRQEFRFAEGDLYSPTLVEDTKKRLITLGFDPQFSVSPGSQSNRVVVTVTVRDP